MTDDRIDVANQTTQRLFKMEFPSTPRPGEPDSAADLYRILNEHAFTDSWTRTALDDRTRSIATVAVLATLGIEDKLRAHVGGAISLGVTPDELVDLFIHVAVYAGVARAATSWDVVSDVLGQRAARRAAKLASEKPASS